MLNTTDQRLCLWLVPVFAGVLVLAFSIFPGFFPPMPPTLPADEVAAFYRENAGRIRASMVIVNLCAVMFIPFFMVIVVQMQRMANPSRAFAYSYLSAAASGATLFFLADLAWLIAAYRPERNPELTMLLNDLAWMAFVTPVGFMLAQNLSLALGVYMDASPEPVFPRWVGHFNIVTAVLMVPGAFAMVFQSGPFAWNGILAFWLRFGAYALYVAVMFFVVRSAIERQDREAGAMA